MTKAPGFAVPTNSAVVPCNAFSLSCIRLPGSYADSE
jgi:hypothetical protein